MSAIVPEAKTYMLAVSVLSLVFQNKYRPTYTRQTDRRTERHETDAYTLSARCGQHNI